MNISLRDKIISLFSYLTLGTVGLIWIIYASVKKIRIEYFLYFNICQAIFISILLAIISVVYDILLKLMLTIPFVGNLAEKFDIFFNGTPIHHSYTISGLIVVVLIAYLCICSILGKTPFLPFVSRIIKENFRR